MVSKMIWIQSYLGPKENCVQYNFSKTKYLGSNKFVGQKKFWSQNFFDLNKFGPNKCLLVKHIHDRHGTVANFFVFHFTDFILQRAHRIVKSINDGAGFKHWPFGNATGTRYNNNNNKSNTKTKSRYLDQQQQPISTKL